MVTPNVSKIRQTAMAFGVRNELACIGFRGVEGNQMVWCWRSLVDQRVECGHSYTSAMTREGANSTDLGRCLEPEKSVVLAQR